MKRNPPSLPAATIPAMVFAVLASACGGSGGGGAVPLPPPPAGPGAPASATPHVVTLSWLPSHESAVNAPGGGYIVNISGQPPVNCPFSGFAPPCTSPTSLQVTLLSGAYTVTVSAYSALNAPGSTAGSTSAPSAPLVVQVP